MLWLHEQAWLITKRRWEKLHMNVVLIGFMGCGKTTIGRELSRATKMLRKDTDEMIVEDAGMPITEIFKAEGEEGFRKRETELLAKLVRGGQDGIIYSTGGGIVMQEANREFLKKLGTVVFLRLKPETVIQRIGHDTTRPLLQGSDRMKKVRLLMARRREAYEECADLVIDVDGLQPRDVVKKILEQL